MLKKLTTCLVLLAACASSSASFASVATIRLIARVPVMCSIDEQGASIEGGQVVLLLHRRCNTSHVVDISAAGMPSDVRIQFNNVAIGTNGAEIPQDEGYYDRTDRLVLQSPSSDPDRLAQVVSELNVSVFAA